MNICLRLVLCLLGAIASGAATADQRLPVWAIEGHRNTVYLVGSIHLLREQDYPLPAGIEAAYDDAETLVMELDMDDLDDVELQTLVAELGMAGVGSSLSQMMGAELYERAEAGAAHLNIPLNMLAAMEPWLAAITVEQLMLQRLGFDPGFGIEAHFARKAGADAKEILGLEDIEEQLGFLDSLSLDAQRLLLLQTLDEAGDLQVVMDSIIDAWRNGDVGFLEEQTLADMQAYPELYDTVVVNRNRNWSKRIADMLDDDDDYLVIVGTLHLIGSEGVPVLLDAMGYPVKQMQQPD